TGPREARVEQLDIGAPGAGQARVRALCSGLSQGSELALYRGLIEPSSLTGTLDPSLPDRSPPGQPYPVRYGYASVGVIEALGEPVASRGALTQGTVVFAFAPHQTHYLALLDALHALPPGLDVERGIFAANLETAVNAVWDGEIALGDRVVILGQGIVGLLI